MKRAYLSVLRLIVMILAFLLGMVSAVILVMGAGYFVATNVSIDGLSNLGIKINTDAILDEDVEEPVRNMTLVDLFKEIGEVAAISDKATLDYLSEHYGLILPPKGSSGLFDAFRTIPFATLFSPEGLDVALEGVYVGDFLGYVKTTDETDPENPIEYWYDPETNEKVTGIESNLADQTVAQLMGGVNVSEIAAGVPIGEILGYSKNASGEWVKVAESGDVEILTGSMAFIADKTFDTITGIDDEPIGNILGYKKAPDGKWYDKTGAPMTGALRAFADNSLNNIENAIGDAQIGVVLGYDRGEDGIWRKNGIPMDGAMKAFADETLNTLETELDYKPIGELLGYTKGTAADGAEWDGVWYKVNSDTNLKEPMTGTMKAFADKNLGNLEEGIEEEPLGNILGYTKVGYVWYTEDALGNPVEPSGVMKFLANKKINEVENSINSEKIGIILGYTYNEGDGKWYDGADELTGVMKVVAGKTFDNIDTLNDEPIGIILGYTDVNPDPNVYDWQDKNSDPVTGIMKIMADETFDNVETTIKNKEMGYFLGYTDKNPDPNVYDWYDESNAPVTGIMKVMASEKFDTVENLSDKLTLDDLVPDREGSFLVLLDGSTPLNDLSGASTERLKTATIQELINCGALDVKYNSSLNDTVKGYTITQLLDEFVRLQSN